MKFTFIHTIAVTHKNFLVLFNQLRGPDR